MIARFWFRGVQSQAVTKIEQSLIGELNKMIKRTSDRNRDVTGETKTKHVGESQEIGKYDVSHQIKPNQASKIRIHQDPDLQGHSIRHHLESSYVQARMDACGYHSLPTITSQTSKQLRRRFQTERARTRQVIEEGQKLENLSHLEKWKVRRSLRGGDGNV